ncbi:MAG: MYG1 family protein [Acetobacter sp.]|jgi:uncharacterized UPF0160 family protein|nr:MYG1 family protein [Acetobacter sp.]MCH4062785.1 MYG1 family protein [Acetobacter sp.]MCH4088372.1 MYG1 family protein [Acetobacter sp.]MCI1294815.1 MYG1 family protein [Acetobacter sp.]MCI1321446.1 MYG1 family protein [Acetobacter sp.]
MTEHTPIGLSDPKQTITAVTHSGNFHIDETLGYVILHYALAPEGDIRERVINGTSSGRLTLQRTRTSAIIDAADIAFDVGNIHDPAIGRYDHHMRNKPLRPGGIPYSAAGLLWKDYGLAAIRNMLSEPVDEETLQAIWQSIDKSLIIPVDQDDNGVARMGRLSLADLIVGCNPPWDTIELYGEKEAKKREMNGFADGAAIIATHLVHMTDRLRASLKATSRVLEAFEKAEDKRILVMETGMPTEKVIFEHDLPVIFVVSPAHAGQWNVKAVPPVKGDFGQRVSLPEAWRGLEGKALADASGIPDAVFAHPARFICGAVSRESALLMAQKALQIDAELKDE